LLVGKLLSLHQAKPHELKSEKVLTRLDGGASCFVAIHKYQFIHLNIRKINCTLGLGVTSKFEGIGISAITFPEDPSTIHILCPVYYSPTDDCPTISNGKLRKTKAFKQVIHDSGRFLYIINNNNSTIKLPCIERNNIDYININFINNIRGKPSKIQQILPHDIELRKVTNHPPSSPFLTLLLHIKYGH
jgi:hypothetical protein